MMNKHYACYILILILIVLNSCSAGVKTVRLVDKSGTPIRGAQRYPFSPFGRNEASGRNGKLRVYRNFPVIRRDGFLPVMVDMAREDFKVVEMEKSSTSLTREEEMSKLLELNNISGYLNAKFLKGGTE